MLIKNFNIGDIIDTNRGQIKILSLEGTIIYRSPQGINETQLYSLEYNGQIYYTSDMGIMNRDVSIFDRCVANIGYRGYINFHLYKKEYEIWKNMLYRCYWQNSNMFQYFGAIGITVHPRWHSFEMFLYDLVELNVYEKFVSSKNIYEIDLSQKQKNIPFNQRIYMKGKISLRPFYATDVGVCVIESKNKGSATATNFIEPKIQPVDEKPQYIYDPGRQPPNEVYAWIITHPPKLPIPSMEINPEKGIEEKERLKQMKFLQNKLKSGMTLADIIEENRFIKGGET